MERFNYLIQKQYEDAMYLEEMHYKEIYYVEAGKQNKEYMLSDGACIRG